MNALLNSIHIKNDVFSYKLYNTIAILAILIVVIFVLYWVATKKSFRQCFIVFLNNQVFTILLALAAIQVLYQVVHNVESILDFSVLTAFVTTFLINIISSVVRDYFRNQDEDPTKLTTHYDELIVKYYGSKDKFYKLKEKDSDGNPFRIPIIRDYGIKDISSVYVNDNIEKMYKISPSDDRTESIYEYRDELFRAHDASNIYNQLNIKVDNWYVDDHKELVLCTSRTTFYASLMTNRVMDYKMKNGCSVRELLQPGPFVPELKKSALSNHLGMNAFIVSNDGYIPFVKRSSTVSIGKRTYGSSISASLKTKYALKSVEDRFNTEGLKKAICGEIKDELNISSDDINEIEIIAAYRDVVEGNKPQLLVYVEVNKTKKEINKGFKRLLKKKRNNKLSVEEIEEQDGKNLTWFKADQFQKIDVYANKFITKGILNTKKYYSIVPSVGFSILETQKYIDNYKKKLLEKEDMKERKSRYMSINFFKKCFSLSKGRGVVEILQNIIAISIWLIIIGILISSLSCSKNTVLSVVGNLGVGIASSSLVVLFTTIIQFVKERENKWKQYNDGNYELLKVLIRLSKSDSYNYDEDAEYDYRMADELFKKRIDFEKDLLWYDATKQKAYETNCENIRELYKEFSKQYSEFYNQEMSNIQQNDSSMDINKIYECIDCMTILSDGDEGVAENRYEKLMKM